MLSPTAHFLLRSKEILLLQTNPDMEMQLLAISPLLLFLSLFPFSLSAATDYGGRGWWQARRGQVCFPRLNDSHDVSVDYLGHHAGYYKLQHSYAGRMFYFFFESRSSNKNDPVVIWLTGGPGCSSELALFYEIGPFRLSKNLSLVWNEYGWDKVSNLIYVDQPIGSGFSYSSDKRDIRDNEDSISNDLFDFLQAFFERHPQFANNDFYIAGESYAGHYIPAFAARIQKGNQAKEGIHINLKGLAIGNGLVNPAIQYKAFPDYALKMGLINKTDYNRVREIVPVCQMGIKLCENGNKLSCLASYDFCNTIFKSIEQLAGNFNRYDIRKKCEGQLCYDFSDVVKFLNQKAVRDALSVGDIDFALCNRTVFQALLADWLRSSVAAIPALLEDGINILVYAGEYDFRCNWIGVERWVRALKWSGGKNFAASPEIPFEVDGSVAGTLTSYGPLAYLKVLDAGHLVPMDQPKVALEMLKRWIRGSLSGAMG